SMALRRATHAGSWYTDRPDQLDQQLTSWLAAAGPRVGAARAIVSPHAGYQYCGAVAGYAYKQIDPGPISRVILLGPSHHFSLRGCGLSTAAEFQTPLGNLRADQATTAELRATGQFEMVSLNRDEAEHSLEMQLPFLLAAMRPKSPRDFSIVPIMVGAIDPSVEAAYGAVLAPYLNDPATLFVVSSDFCHWGRRFEYTHYDKSAGRIWQSIERLDRQGMEAIETGRPDRFTQYLQQTGNTICGRHPIGVMMCAAARHGSGRFRFLNYAQSSKCNDFSDSSVSYAAGGLFVNA
uniref:MEMO1 family protein n=2 Tax=Macrostomum lignano TaxID=282301 RepID=A0A1I8JDF9_9PLAT